MSAPAPFRSPGERIVVCHDDHALLNSITSLLRCAGYCVFEASDRLACYEIAHMIPELRLLVMNTSVGPVVQPDLIDQLQQNLPTVTVLQVGAGQAEQPEQLLASVGEILDRVRRPAVM
jgi:hypothetical protein